MLSRKNIAILLFMSFSTIFAADAPQVTGKYLGNNEEAKLTHAVAVPMDNWNGEKAYQIILTEKDPSTVAKPEFHALFGKLGHALLVKVTQSGKIFGTEICHQGLEHAGVSQVGVLQIEKFKIEASTIHARLFTKGPAEIFDETWECDLTIAAAIKSK